MGLRWTPEEWTAHAKKQLSPLANVASVVKLLLPFPPTVNHSTKPNGRGGKILTDQHREFRAEVAQIVALHGSPRVVGRMGLDLLLQAPTKRKFDIDNRLKAVLDALQLAGVYADDEAFDVITIRRGGIAAGGMARVTVFEL